MERSFTHGITGSTNLQLGLNTLQNVTTGTNNTAFGFETYRYLVSGSYNTGFGYGITNNVSGNPSTNTDLGSTVASNLTTATDVAVVGYQALDNLTIGSNNAVFGNNAGSTLVDGTNNVLFGNYTDTFTSNSNDTLMVGSLTTGMSGANGNIIGNRKVMSSTDATFSVGFDGETDSDNTMIYIGTETGGANDFGNLSSTVVGHRVCNIPPGSFGFLSDSIVLGNDSLGNSPGGTIMAIGSEAALNINAFGPTVIGCQAGQALTSTVVFGETVVIGFRASAESIGDAIGAYASEKFKNGFSNTALGYQAFQYADGDWNTAVGYRALRGAVAASVPDIAAGTAVGASKITSVLKVLDFTTSNPEISDVDFTGATPASLGGTYFLLSALTGDYYVWYNHEFVSTDPAVSGRIGIMVSIFNGYSSSDIANATSGTLTSTPIAISSTYGDSARVLDVENIGNGDVTDIGPGTAVGSPSKILSVLKLADGTGGSPELNRIDFGNVELSLMQGAYFLISSVTTDYYVWYSVDGNGPDPMVAGRTGLEVTLFNFYNSDNIYFETMFVLINTGEFNANSRSNDFIRIYAYAYTSYNSALGANALMNCLGGESNTIVGTDAAMTMVGGSENTIIGKGADVPVSSLRNTIVGFGAVSAANQCIVMGRNASSTAFAGTVFGAEANVTTVHGWQFGKAVVLGTARMKFQNQVICDETWIGGGLTDLKIDTNGNFIRGLPENNTVSTTDATATVIYTLPVIPTDTTVRLEALVLGRRTGGSAGAANDTAAYLLQGVVKNTGGVITITAPPIIILEDQAAWNVDFFNSVGTTVVIRVIGAVNNNINWEARVRRLAI